MPEASPPAWGLAEALRWLSISGNEAVLPDFSFVGISPIGGHTHAMLQRAGLLAIQI